VEFSADGNKWQTLSVTAATKTMAWDGVWAVDWSAGPVRFLKLSPARDMDRPWQISELRVK
jgi:hypothetical protein